MLEIYEKKEKKSKPIYLKLVKVGGQINLVAVDKHGDERPNGLILCINEDGVKLIKGLDKNIGLSISKKRSTVKCEVL